jgi:hypothetical protein
MATQSKTVERAINTSIRENRIVTLPTVSIAHEYDVVLTDLTCASDDRAEANDVIEFWGTDDDGDEWRVHIGRRDDAEASS